MRGTDVHTEYATCVVLKLEDNGSASAARRTDPNLGYQPRLQEVPDDL